MTIVIALNDKQNKRIILGTDKQATWGQLIFNTNDKIIELPIDITDGYGNVFETETLYIGFCGLLYLSSFLKYGFEPPVMNEKQKFIEYLYNNFLPELKGLLYDDNLVEVNNNVTDIESGLILIFKDKVYNVSSRFGVNVLEEEYIVEGSGRQVALGSLCTNLTYNPNLDYKKMVEQAIKVCGVNTIYCDDQVNIKIIKY